MSDIVEKLRTVGHIDYALMDEAADLITRLRAENEELRASIERYRSDRHYILGHNDGWEAATAEAFERAAQIANKVARQFAEDGMPREEDGADEAAAAIRKASGEDNP